MSFGHGHACFPVEFRVVFHLYVQYEQELFERKNPLQGLQNKFNLTTLNTRVKTTAQYLNVPGMHACGFMLNQDPHSNHEY